MPAPPDDPRAPLGPAGPGEAPSPARRPTPAVMLQRLSGPLASLLACGVARREEPGVITLMVRQDEAETGGMATIAMPVDLWCPSCAAPATDCARCGGTRTVQELYSAWLAVRPGVTTGDELAPSVQLPGVVTPVRFRVRLHASR